MEGPRFLGLPQTYRRRQAYTWEFVQESGDLHALPWLPGPQSAIPRRGSLGLSSPQQETSDLISQMVRFLAASSFMKSNLPLPGPSPTPAKNVRGQEAPLLLCSL